MSIKTEHGWKCSICHKEFVHAPDALSCENSHDVIYVPIMRDDLYRLIQFLYTGDTSLLSQTLINTLMKYKAQLKGR